MSPVFWATLWPDAGLTFGVGDAVEDLADLVGVSDGLTDLVRRLEAVQGEDGMKFIHDEQFLYSPGRFNLKEVDMHKFQQLLYALRQEITLWKYFPLS